MLKIIAYIFSLVLLFVMVQPVIGSNNNAMGKNCISNCCDKKQDKKQHSENKDCNPFLACSLAAWLQSPKVTVNNPEKYLFKQQYFIFNDNRIIKHLSSLFHPPNMV